MGPAALVLLSGMLAIIRCEALREDQRHGPASPAATEMPVTPADTLRVEVNSDPQLTELEARTQAEGRLKESLLEAAVNRTRCDLPLAALARRMPQLLYGPGVRREEHTEVVPKPYGTVYWHHVALSVPNATLQSWASEAARHHGLTVLIRIGAAGLTVLGWLCGWLVTVRLDRWTRGYCRPAIVAGTLAVLGFATGLGWFLVLI